MYEINLTCPVCGNYKFTETENGQWYCDECYWIGDIEEMSARVYSLD